MEVLPLLRFIQAVAHQAGKAPSADDKAATAAAQPATAVLAESTALPENNTTASAPRPAGAQNERELNTASPEPHAAALAVASEGTAAGNARFVQPCFLSFACLQKMRGSSPGCKN